MMDLLLHRGWGRIPIFEVRNYVIVTDHLAGKVMLSRVFVTPRGGRCVVGRFGLEVDVV